MTVTVPVLVAVIGQDWTSVRILDLGLPHAAATAAAALAGCNDLADDGGDVGTVASFSENTESLPPAAAFSDNGDSDGVSSVGQVTDEDCGDSGDVAAENCGDAGDVGVGVGDDGFLLLLSRGNEPFVLILRQRGDRLDELIITVIAQ